MLTFYTIQFDKESDKEIFLELHNNYERKMYSVALSILKSPTLAEDAVHDSFIKIINNFKKFKQIPCNEIDGWIVIIVKNTSLNILRKENRLISISEDFDMMSNDSLESESEYDRLVSLIRSMPENYRSILEMKYVLEYSNIEIAKALGITENAVGVRIHRGRAKLIKILKKEGFSYE